MPQQPVAHCCRIVPLFGDGTEQWSNVFHFTKTSYSLADMEALADAIDVEIGTVLMPNFPSGMAYVSTTAYDLRSSTGPVYVANASATAGSVAGEMLPVNIACCITLRTAQRGRSGRGRVYVGGWLESAQQDGSFVGGSVTLAEQFVDNIAAEAVALGWTHVIVSRQQNGVELTTPEAFPVILTESRNARVTTQRRRLDRP